MSGSCDRVAELLYELVEVLGEISATLKDLVAIECGRLVMPTRVALHPGLIKVCEEYIEMARQA